MARTQAQTGKKAVTAPKAKKSKKAVAAVVAIAEKSIKELTRSSDPEERRKGMQMVKDLARAKWKIQDASTGKWSLNEAGRERKIAAAKKRIPYLQDIYDATRKIGSTAMTLLSRGARIAIASHVLDGPDLRIKVKEMGPWKKDGEKREAQF